MGAFGPKRLLLVSLTLAAPSAFASNFATCLLDNLPGTQNDIAASAVYQVCQGKHPGLIAAVAQGSGRGMFGFDSGAECTAKKAADARSNRAAVMVGVACRRLYDKATLTYEEAYGLPSKR